MKQKSHHLLYLHEIYSSVQGETSFVGLPTLFIRLSACNLRCSWCDTPYAFGRGKPYTLEAILLEAERLSCRHVCLTGGEPLLQGNLYPLMDSLLGRGHILSLETGGSLAVDKVPPQVHIILDVKCPGSGMSHKNHWPNLALMQPKDEVKFVLLDRSDYEYSKQIATQYDLWGKTQLLLSPVHGKLDPKQLVAWMLEDKLSARLNLQQHKYIWSPTTQGV